MKKNNREQGGCDRFQDMYWWVVSFAYKPNGIEILCTAAIPPCCLWQQNLLACSFMDSFPANMLHEEVKAENHTPLFCLCPDF